MRWSGWNIPRDERERRNGHRAAVIWLTGLPGSGKTTIARAIERRLFDSGCQTMLLDGDQLRHGLCGDLGFSPAERAENIRRAGEAARLFFEQGSLVLCAFVSPYRSDRNQVRALLPEGAFVEVFVSAPLETCMQRDPKGLYARARRGEVPQLTGVGAPYEVPTVRGGDSRHRPIAHRRQCRGIAAGAGGAGTAPRLVAWAAGDNIDLFGSR